ncbi:MAG: hypothetical protein LBP21_09270 [Synergistaceae bacterium]|jgi:hypothetical protein|nr:hypothetical protein [Synergistaceae bacterium]
MKAKSVFLCPFLLVLFVILASGGCGGGGDDKSIDFSVLSGTWEAIEGSGTASGDGDEFKLRLNEGVMEFELVDLKTDEATVRVPYKIDWDVYYQDVLDSAITLENDNAQSLVKRTGANKFSYTYPDGSAIDVTVTSDSTATVVAAGPYETDGKVYQYNVTYTMKKFDENEVAEDVPIDLSALAGKWTVKSGSGSGAGSPVFSEAIKLKFVMGEVSFTINASGVTIDHDIYWNIYMVFEGEHYIGYEYSPNVSQVNVERISANKFRCTYPSDSEIDHIDITVTSDTTATAEEESNDYSVTYTMEKTGQNP